MPERVNIDTDIPRSLRDPAEIYRRKAMLRQPHMTALNEYDHSLRERKLGEVPDFDALDGGAAARILFLFEKPGPMTSKDGSGNRIGSGFISRNNDDPTAEATFNFMIQARIPRHETVVWNTIPAWNGTRRVTNDELRSGAAYFVELVALLPQLRAVVLVGKRAERLRSEVTALRTAIFTSAHPSPLVKASSPEKWRGIGDEWSRVMAVIHEGH